MSDEIRIMKNCIGICQWCVQPVLADVDKHLKLIEDHLDYSRLPPVPVQLKVIYHEDCYEFGKMLGNKNVSWPKSSPDTSLTNKERREQFHNANLLRPITWAYEMAKDLFRDKEKKQEG